MVENLTSGVVIQRRDDVLSLLFDEFLIIVRPQDGFEAFWRGDEAEESKRR